jgi:gas vesicle protein
MNSPNRSAPSPRRLLVLGAVLALTLFCGCERPLKDRVFTVYSYAEGTRPLADGRNAVFTALHSYADDKDADPEQLKKAVEKLEKAIADRRHDIDMLDKADLKGKTVSDLIVSCKKHLKAHEDLLDEAKRFQEKIQNQQGRKDLDHEAQDVLNRTGTALRDAVEDYGLSAADFEHEYAAALKEQGIQPSDDK